jgi:nitroimidazol reductase NimA-like FMN-containing flavoprotein (pyridoxamine 5'-phosphate oxidase superfamily)
MSKRVAPKKKTVQQSGPIVDRPHIPGYGVPTHLKGLLPWSHVIERMEAAQNYWICTVGPNHEPHATPVWGLWLDDRLYFGGGPNTRRQRNLKANPAVCLHLESGSDVLILHGEAQPLGKPERALTLRLLEISQQKYGYAPSPEEYEAGENITVFRPRKVLAWTQFPKDATRWQFTKIEK